MSPWLGDLLTFIGIAVAVFYAGAVVIVLVLRAYVMRSLRRPVRRFGRELALELCRQQEETGETPPELESLMDEIRAMACGGVRYPPQWMLRWVPRMVALGVAWLVTYA